MGTNPGFVGISTNPSAPPLSATALNNAFTAKCDSNAATNVANASAYAINGITTFVQPVGDPSNTSVGIGMNVLLNVAGGLANTAFGYQSLEYLTSGSYNLAIGFQALNLVTSGNNNVGLGYTAINMLTTGSNNVGIGAYALAGVTTQLSNVAIGVNGLKALTSGSNNTVVGASAMIALTTGSLNVSIGSGAYYKLTTGSSNVMIGTGGNGNTLTSGSYNILIGAGNSVDVLSPTTSNYMNIGQVIYATGILGNGTLTPLIGINNPNPQLTLDVTGTTRISAGMTLQGGMNIQTGLLSLSESQVTATGTIMGLAAPITTIMTRISSTAANLGVILPVPTANGMLFILSTLGSTYGALVYPPNNTESINGGSNGAPATLTAGTVGFFGYLDSGAWFLK